MKRRYWALILLLPVLQVLWGGFTKYWAVPAFPRAEGPANLDAFIATQSSDTDATSWLKTASGELKRYERVYSALYTLARSQSDMIFVSGCLQFIIIGGAIVITRRK